MMRIISFLRQVDFRSLARLTFPRFRNSLSVSSQSSSLPPQGPEGVKQLGHRTYVGGLWNEMGSLQFQFLLDQGLRPSHRLLDVACGSLRLGVRVIPYLDPGHYFGIEKEQSLLDAGIEQELGDAMAHLKKPNLLCSSNFDYDQFAASFDFAIIQSLFTHLPPAAIGLCLSKLRPHMRHGSTVFATFFESEDSFYNPLDAHDHGYFAYTQQEMADFGTTALFTPHFIGDWGHPRGQVMVAYRAVSPQ